MSVVLCTLCLNEMEHLPKLYEQHKDWPGLKAWIFVESADQVYARTNPELVSKEGLSVDGTTDFLWDLKKQDDRIIYMPYGYTSAADPAQGKCAARTNYLQAADYIRPKFLFVLDADEFYTHSDQSKVMGEMSRWSLATGFVFKQRHIWRPPSVAHTWKLFNCEAVGAYWNIPHTRGWRWSPGLRYERNHNTPQSPNGFMMDNRLKRLDIPGGPQCAHLGFASSLSYRSAKHRYYQARGEGTTDKRQMYVDCRTAYETWQPGDRLPHGAKVKRFTGHVPEIFKEQRDG